MQSWVSSEYINLEGCDDSCSYSDNDWAYMRLDKPLGAKWGYLPLVEFEPNNMPDCQYCSYGMVSNGLQSSLVQQTAHIHTHTRKDIYICTRKRKTLHSFYCVNLNIKPIDACFAVY